MEKNTEELVKQQSWTMLENLPFNVMLADKDLTLVYLNKASREDVYKRQVSWSVPTLTNPVLRLRS